MQKDTIRQKFEEKQEYQRQIELIGQINAQRFKPGAVKKLTDGYKSIRRQVKKQDNFNRIGISSKNKSSRNVDAEVEKSFAENLEDTLKSLKITPGKSFTAPEWNIEQDFLFSYKVLNAKIPSFECVTDEQKELKRQKGKKRPCYYKYLEMMTEGHY